MPTLQQAQAWYKASDPIHDFAHVSRVYRMAERIARAERADLELVRAAALLHDAEGSAPGSPNESRAHHHEASARFARQVLGAEGWPADRIAAVEHCIRAHRFRATETPRTLEAQVLFDADKLDVLGAIGAARTIAYAVLDNQPIFAEASPHFLATGEKLPGEPHSSYHEFLFKLSKIKDRLYTTTGRALAEARHAFLVEFYEQLALEMQGLR